MTYPFWSEVQSHVFNAKTYVGAGPNLGLAVILDETTIDGKEWRHLSVSRRSRTPNYEEVDRVRRTFLGEDAVTMHIWPPKAEYVNLHPHCLHLWQPIGFDPVPDPHGERKATVGW